MKKNLVRLSVLSVFLVSILVAVNSAGWAQNQICTLKQEIQVAILSNPDIQEKWHAFKAAGLEKRSASAGLGPRVDITAGFGYDNIDGKGYEDRDFFYYSHDGTAVTLRQLIYDGGLTRNEIERLGHLRMVRYFELLSAVESITLETVRAYEDVNRYRKLVDLAAGNLERHMEVIDQVEKRVTGGFDSRSSLEEIRGRLAVANVNLLTEKSNLHDVSARYQRITGHIPPDVMEACDITFQIPSCAEDALKGAMQNNPSLFAARETALAADAALRKEVARSSPRVELKGGYRSDHDVDGVDGRKDKWYGEVSMTYTIYDGGAQENAMLQRRELALQAVKRQEVTERDILQTLKVAYNDLQMLQGQTGFLQEHQKASGEVRDAYLQQFKIGRRSLPDLLDSENEYYQAGRAMLNAQFNILTAKARILAATGRLVSVTGAVREDIPALEEMLPDRNACGAEEAGSPAGALVDGGM